MSIQNIQTGITDITDVEAISMTSNVISAEAATPVNRQPTQDEIMAFMRHMQARHNAKCRKKGFKDHIHQPAGNKLSRKLARAGTLYGRLSLVGEMMKDIQARKFKEAKEHHAAI